METKKYTTHSSFWGNIALFISWAAFMLLEIICWKPSDIISIVLISLLLVFYLVMAIQCRLAWHAYVEISEEGVKMKGCAKRISENKKETIDDLFIPWENIEEIRGGFNGTVLELKTGERIILTQQISIDGKTLRKAFEQYKSKPQPEQTQEGPFIVVGVFGQDSDSTSKSKES